MIKKYSRKKKFINRGVYFILEGEYKGAFIMNIKELDTPTEKAFMVLPDNTRLNMTPDMIKESFESGYFDYVKTIPKKFYDVCLEELKGKAE